VSSLDVVALVVYAAMAGFILYATGLLIAELLKDVDEWQ